MNQIESVKHKVEMRIPGVTGVIDKPLKAEGPWMLDFFFHKKFVNVEWRRHRGFGISSGLDHGFGEGPDEILPDVAGAAQRVVELLGGNGQTALPEELTLKQLRGRQKLSQAEFAQRLHISQAAVSELEGNISRSKLSTLLKALRALGARLDVFAVLPSKRAFKLKL